MEKLKKRIISFIESTAPEQLQFVIELGNQNSYTYNKPGTDRVAEIVLNQLNGILPHHEVFKQNEVGDHHLLKSNLSARAIYLLGHLDAVFPPEHAFQKCHPEGDLLYGPGTADMKGGIAVMVYALKALKEVGLLKQLSIAVILSGDEEIGSKTSRTIYLNERKNAIACLVAECAGINNEIVVSRNGKMGVRIDCFGQDRHVGSGTHEKASAILEIAHKILAVESLNASLAGVSVNVGKIEGGLGAATVPAHASCQIDIRWREQEHHEILFKKIQEITSQVSQPGCHSQFEILNSRPAMPLSDGNEDLFQLIQKVGEELGQEIKPEHRRGTSDANFFGSAGIPSLDGFGPIGGKDHTPNEFIKIVSLKERTALLALFLLGYGRKSGMLPQPGVSEKTHEERQRFI